MDCRVDGSVYNGRAVIVRSLATLGYAGYLNYLNNFHNERENRMRCELHNTIVELNRLRGKLEHIREMSDYSIDDEYISDELEE